MKFIDRGHKVLKYEETAQGYLKVKVYLCRTGMYTYTGRELGLDQHLWDRKYQVYRSPEEVFKPESMETFKELPATDDHPAKVDEHGNVVAVMLDSTNTKEYARGYTGQQLNIVKSEYTDDYLLDSTATITDQDLIDSIKSGEKTEVSCGYDARLRPSESGELGDYVMEGMVGNHLAFLAKGRAGEQCSIHDSRINLIGDLEMNPKKDVNTDKANKTANVQVKDGDGFPEMVQENPTSRGDQVHLDPKSGKNLTGSKPHIKACVLDSNTSVEDRFGMMVDYMGDSNKTFADSLNGVQGQVSDLSNQIQALTDALEGLKKPKDDDKDDKDDKDKKSKMQDGAPKENDELAKAQKEVGRLQALLDSAPTQEDIVALAKEYSDTVSTAKELAPSLQITDGMSAIDVKRSVCRSLNDSVNFDEKSEDYVNAYFDSYKRQGNSVHPMIDQIGRATADRHSEAERARQEMLQEDMNAWKS